MKRQKKGLVYRRIRMFIVLLFVAGVLVAAAYPFDNRNLTIAWISDNGEEFEISLSNQEIAGRECSMLRIPELFEKVLITKVRFYGKSRTMRIMEMTPSGFYGFLADPAASGVAWEDSGMLITPADGQVLYMNEAFLDKMQELSSAYLQERLLLIGILGCVMLLAMMLVTAIEDWKSEENWDNHSLLHEVKKFVSDMDRYKQYMYYAAKTDLKAEVANSYLNRLWWLLEPFFNMLVYVIVFGKIMGNSIENYATFIYASLLMWNFFSKTINYSVKLVRNNKDIISKVYVPKFILLFSNMILNFIKLLFSLTVLVPMLVIFHVHITWTVVWIIPAYLVLILLSFGVGMIFLHFGVYVDDLAYAVGIVLNMLMFLSGIFYDVMTTLDTPLDGVMLALNPVAMTIDTMRNALLYGTVANVPQILLWMAVSAILCCIGVHIVYKNENAYVKIV
ncbi:MAG: ABC transporter permease [Eubacterium sp.]|nr:ABC transporter permease [Eubacterium sp.]